MIFVPCIWPIDVQIIEDVFPVYINDSLRYIYGVFGNELCSIGLPVWFEAMEFVR